MIPPIAAPDAVVSLPVTSAGFAETAFHQLAILCMGRSYHNHQPVVQESEMK
jgi:hypothetical protein